MWPVFDFPKLFNIYMFALGIPAIIMIFFGRFPKFRIKR